MIDFDVYLNLRFVDLLSMEDIACGRGGDTFRSSRQFLTHLLN